MTGHDGIFGEDLARQALADPRVTTEDLQRIAVAFPALRPEVAAHPAADPELLGWLDQFGSPAPTHGPEFAPPGTSATQTAPAGPVPFGQFPGATAGAPAAQFVTAPGSPDYVPPAPPSFPPPGSPWPDPEFNWAEPAPAKPKRFGPRTLAITIGAGVLVIALVVTGFLTRGFGYFALGGADTPEAEAIKVTNKVVDLFNNFTVRDALKDPWEMPASLMPLISEVAPSELLVLSAPELGASSSSSRMDLKELLAVTDQSIDLTTEIVRSFHATAANLKVESTLVSEDVAQVKFTGGTIVVEADTAKLRGALERVEATAASQVSATAAKYGIPATPPKFEAGWVDDALKDIEANFPLTIDLAEPEGALSYESPFYWVESYIRGIAGRVIVVQEADRWYFSPILTMAGWGVTSGDQKVVPQAAANQTPMRGAEALADAINSANSSKIAANLALADRRLLVYSGYFGDIWPPTASPVTQFRQIASQGDHTKLRIDKYDPIPSGGSIESGTCVQEEYGRYCLEDWLTPESLASWASDYLVYGLWRGYEADGPWQDPKLGPKFEAMQKAILAKFDVDQIGLVMVQEGGSWHASPIATLLDLRNQIFAALGAGLAAAEG